MKGKEEGRRSEKQKWERRKAMYMARCRFVGGSDSECRRTSTRLRQKSFPNIYSKSSRYHQPEWKIYYDIHRETKMERKEGST